MIKERLTKLRYLMKEQHIEAYLVPGTDPHQNEYLPDVWMRRQWISGFTGSAGDVVITTDKAGLWTDSRYFLQAEQQLKDSGIMLFKSGLPDTPSISAWLKTEIKPEDSVGLDPKLFSHTEAEKLINDLKDAKISVVAVDENLVDRIWEDQPAHPADPVKIHPVKYSGETFEEKLQRVREQMRNENAEVHLLTALDAIAWLFNIRGNDIQYNPVVISYAIITPDKAFLFVQQNKISREIFDLFADNVQIVDYENFEEHLEGLAGSGKRIWLDPGATSFWIANKLKSGSELLYKETPVTGFKARKNKTEIAGLKTAHVRDGVAMVKFLHWLEENVPSGEVSEISAARQVEIFRDEQDLYQGPSFTTIAGYGAHGAIVHYSASPETDAKLKPEGIFLFDSGAQYLDGTTDITRTLALGTPTSEQCDRFTRVLKGHIRLATARFPRGTAGNQLDTIARKPLWDIGLNFGHGTGHGIGSFLNVHEGPQAISYYRGIGVALDEGMVISNEPGYYKTGEYGIRTENLIVVVKDEKYSGKETDFLKFETVTYCPIDLNLVEKSLLTEEEIRFLNEYHQKVRELLSPFLTADELNWLEKATRTI